MTEPIVHELTLACTPGEAFTAYAERIGEWWDPRYTADPGTFQDVVIEPGVGGRVVERHEGGREHEWGEVVVWAPGRELAYTSTLAQSGPASLVSVRFAAAGEGAAVVFEHGGWTTANEQDRARFGDWPVLLARYAEAATG